MIVYRKKVLQIGAPHERRHPLEGGGIKITTFVPLQFKRRGVSKVVVAPANVEKPVTDRSQSPSLPPSHDSTLLRALGRGIYWQHLLDTGVVADTAEIAQREGLHKTFVSDHLRLAILAPALVESALRGELPRNVTRLDLMRDGIPACWLIQRRRLFI
ncbi:MAG: hypothetical protein IPL06_02420 [Betaproteobacteria bacterium]|nr:hypothetical protein [Betaproteobacteria bacterium]